MNHATNTKKLNNQGFSLVELIIVVAIMAVLVGVLAPQYLQYVEKARRQSDLTMIDEIKGAIEVAIATDEDIYTACVPCDKAAEFVSGESAKVSVDSNLEESVKKVITDFEELKLTSKTITAATISIDSNGTVTVNITDSEEKSE